jgi:hypothetical protein
MAIDIADVRRRISRMRSPDISTDDLGPAVDRAGRTLRDWRKSTEAALASLGDLSLDSLPQVSLDSLPGRRRPSPLRRTGPVIAIGLIGVLAGLMIGWWMGNMARMSPGATGRAGAWRGRGRWSRNLDATPPASHAADAAWSVGGQSSTKPAASAAAKVSDSAGSPAVTGHLGEGRDLDTDSQPGDTWRGVGPGQSSEPAGTPEFASRTVRGD